MNHYARLVWTVGLAVNLVFGVFLLASVSIQPASAAFPGTNGKIAFLHLSWEDPNDQLTYRMDIYVMNADGTGQTNLSNNPSAYVGDDFPAWSPDGSKIAFRRLTFPSYVSQIYVMNADGTGQTNLSNSNTYDDGPAWSPDGSKIAFSRGYDLYVMNADGTGQTAVPNSDVGDERHPAWSPDGSKIAFENYPYAIYLINPDGTGLTMLTNHYDEYPDWSPDGSKIVFDSYRDEIWDPTHTYWLGEIYVMNADGSNPTRLTNNAWSDYDPAWSPDGSKIVFTSWGDGSFGQIYVMNADGTGQTNLSNNPFRDEHPNWQPVVAVAPVGGALMPVNWLVILAPYLALVGIVGAVTVAVATKRRLKA